MLSYQTTGAGGPLEQIEIDTPVPIGSEVLLRTIACGVCHSDIHLQESFFDLGDEKKLEVGRSGMVLGHEIFAEVVALGPEVKKVGIGDRRVIYPWIGCDECAICLRGDEHLCTPGQPLGNVKDGGFSDYVIIPDEKYLFEKGDISDAAAATFACAGLTAYGALKKIGDLIANEHVVIVGAGGVGMMAIQIAQAVFNLRPIVVDIDDKKLEEVKKLGVEHTFNAADLSMSKEIVKLTSGGAMAAIDFVGSETSFKSANRTLAKGGKIIVVGLFGGKLEMPLPLLPFTARTIIGNYVASLADMGELMKLVREGKIEPIEIEERPLSAVNEALSDLKAGKVKGRIVLNT
jgi:D-arabinose 1-dehydrogenase-like Zn-dependent alcohol dehydrogenase